MHPISHMTPSDRKLLKAAKARTDDGTRAEEALRQGANPTLRDEYNLTVFIWCARKGHIAVARTLAAAGADIEARDNTKRTAIHHAILFKRAAFVEYLISIGADLSAEDMHGWTALDLAICEHVMPRFDPTIVPRLVAAGAPAPKHPEYLRATAAKNVTEGA